jgi:hypothetical protein
VEETTRKDPKGNKNTAEKTGKYPTDTTSSSTTALFLYPKQILASGRSKRRPQ